MITETLPQLGKALLLLIQKSLCSPSSGYVFLVSYLTVHILWNLFYVKVGLYLQNDIVTLLQFLFT
jgi:hypothetical protein